jgi:hypothetical protein
MSTQRILFLLVKCFAILYPNVDLVVVDSDIVRMNVVHHILKNVGEDRRHQMETVVRQVVKGVKVFFFYQ